ncbi:hypothetical protein ACS0PU_005854 [Formica fusca]
MNRLAIVKAVNNLTIASKRDELVECVNDKVPITTTTDDTPVFDRTRVSLEIPSRAFGTGFTLVTNISKVLNSLILNSARRTQTFLEIFKPVFRGSFAIKGLPSDNLH